MDTKNKTLISLGIAFLIIVATIAVYSTNNKTVVDQRLGNKNSAPNSRQQISPLNRWNTYANKEYGFEFRYPDFYEPFKETSRRNHQGDMYLEKLEGGGFQIKYKSSVEALVSFTTESKNKNFGQMGINIYNLDSYRISDLSGGIEFSFDSGKDQWWQNTPDSRALSLVPEIQIGSELVGYKILVGDAGEGIEYILIPIKTKKVMIEILFFKGMSTTEDIPRDTILSTFKTYDKNGS